MASDVGSDVATSRLAGTFGRGSALELMTWTPTFARHDPSQARTTDTRLRRASHTRAHRKTIAPGADPHSRRGCVRRANTEPSTCSRPAPGDRQAARGIRKSRVR